MQDAKTEVPKAVNAVIFRIAVFYCGSILLLVSMLPTTEYKSGTSPFVTVFERLGLTWMTTAIQVVLIIAALSSLNAGLYSTGRVLRSLGMSKQAPQFTLKMSSSGVPWAGIVLTSVVYVFGSLLNFLAPDAFEIALEAAAIGVIFTWGTIFVCQLRLRQADRPRGDPAQPVPGARIPVDELHRAGLPRAGHRRHGDLGLAELALPRTQGQLPGGRLRDPAHRRGPRHRLADSEAAVVENTGDRLKPVWSDDGPTYGPGVSPDDLDVAEHDPATAGRDLMDLNYDGSFVRRDEDEEESR